MQRSYQGGRVLINDLGFYSKRYLKIKTKDKLLVPLKFNKFQYELSDIVDDLKNQNKPIRIIVLKARQIGISTWGSSYLFHDSVSNKYTKSMMIADDSDNTNNIFNMHKVFYDNIPDEIRPMIRYSNAKTLSFENPNNEQRQTYPGLMSQIVCETGGKATAGRSGTLQNLHITEYAFWRNAADVTSGLLQAVPYIPGTFVLMESTANGMGGEGLEFFNKWKAAEAGESEYQPVFFPWWDHYEYELPVTNDFTLTAYEKELMKIYPAITKEKLAWRRFKIKNEMGSALLSPEDQFRQEYPSCPEEAFLVSGRPAFNLDAIKSDIENYKNRPYKQVSFDGFGNPYDDKHGNFKIYWPPNPNEAYAIGADVAEGLETGDFSAATVIDRQYRVVATYHGHTDPDLFGQELCKLGEYYNKAVLAPEVNNHGHATIAKIKSLKYLNIYKREIKEETADKMTLKLGWQTNRKTKMKMLDDFAACYRDKVIQIPDIDLLRQMTEVTINETGDIALGGKDRVVAVCIAIQAIDQAPVGNLEVGYSENEPGMGKILYGENKAMPFKERWARYRQMENNDE